MRDGRQYTFWVYIMASRTATPYIGMTGSFEPRILQHKTGTFEGFSKRHGATVSSIYETYDDAAKRLAGKSN